MSEDFYSILSELVPLPEKTLEKPLQALRPVHDCLNISIQGAKALNRPAILQCGQKPDLIKSFNKDRQGNQVRISEKGSSMAENTGIKTAWETDLSR